MNTTTHIQNARKALPDPARTAERFALYVLTSTGRVVLQDKPVLSLGLDQAFYITFELMFRT